MERALCGMLLSVESRALGQNFQAGKLEGTDEKAQQAEVEGDAG